MDVLTSCKTFTCIVHHVTPNSTWFVVLGVGATEHEPQRRTVELEVHADLHAHI
jgi:hypothetical protein